MSFQGRAWYNLLRMNHKEDPTTEVENWQIADYRSSPVSELFKSLKDLGLHLDVDSILLYTEKCTCPEELAECLLGDADDVDKLERSYLILFELWRRLCTHKQSLSIFCDELDVQIELYDSGSENDDLLIQMLTELEDILDKQADEGENPKIMFKLISSFLAHDLETFLYDFSTRQIEAQNDVVASELVDGYYAYVQDEMWSDFLRVRLVALADYSEATTLLQRLLEKIQDEPNLDLLFEILRYLTYEEEIPLFYNVFELSENLLEKEEDFHTMLEIIANYFNALDREEEDLINEMMERRKNEDCEKQFQIADPDLLKIKKLLETISV
ncbi:hypothetical protein COB11_01700 [Candidatus Aerophobetes bacterium]|uniref:Uncharacterized protein n=1 Tax=Aerophobetes bacterium TaxID=2030807 RepID=A0A2A4YL77_UNCAE|nr:MAG: hypothetical protein COB11_01700 [Candidatus Aerophobetes bacterium]